MISSLKYLTTVPKIVAQAQALICFTTLPSRILNYVEFELQSFGPSIMRLKSIKTKKFLAINSEGLLHTRMDESKDCLFYQYHEKNLFVSFASFKYYMKEHYDMFLGIKRNGKVKVPSSTLPGQDSVQFMVLNVDSL
ncbi:fibroblast growth factor 1-like [Montipora foliosa]|uniref:fibroblast growth factor 1-like n=1 Tax=Montipora foliosa TaxID=591990 RepID=UPI0035F181B3